MCHHPRSKHPQVHYIYFLLTFSIHDYVIPLDLNAQKKQIEHYLGEIQNAVQPIEECDVLNRVVSLLMQASAALKTVTTTVETKPLNFMIKEKFAPAQKNEVQVPFKKTSKEPGRKKQSKQLRYLHTYVQNFTKASSYIVQYT